MKKIGVVTLDGDENIGCRLQNYAVQTKLTGYGYKVETIRYGSAKQNLKYWGKARFFKFLPFEKYRRLKCFTDFYKKVNVVYKTTINPDEYEMFFVGSDQVWNSEICWDVHARNKNIGWLFLDFAPGSKRCSFSASFGTDKVEESAQHYFKENLGNFKKISVREEKGIELVEEMSGRTDAKLLLDPTMLITKDDWNKCLKKPGYIKKNQKFVFTYFLGGMPEEYKSVIEDFAKKNNCEVVNILDRNGKYFSTGPSEFLWLEKNALCVFTNSFHSSVFSIIFNTPFVVFNRSYGGMSSRIETLLDTFGLQQCKYHGSLENDILSVDFSGTKEVFEKKQKEADEFLQSCLNEE